VGGRLGATAAVNRHRKLHCGQRRQ
jgi:hypothetical protein